MRTDELKNIFDLWEGIVFITDKNGKITWVNEYAHYSFDFTRKDLKKLNLEIIGVDSSVLDDSNLGVRSRETLSYNDHSFDVSLSCIKIEDSFLILTRDIKEENEMRDKISNAVDNIKKLNEENLSILEEQNKNIIEVFKRLEVGVIVCDLDGKLLPITTRISEEIFDMHTGNDIWEALKYLGVKEKEAIKKAFSMIESKDSLDMFLRILPKTYNHNDSIYTLDFYWLSEQGIAVVAKNATNEITKSKKLEYLTHRNTIISNANKDLQEFKDLKSEVLYFVDNLCEISKKDRNLSLQLVHDLRKKLFFVGFKILGNYLWELEKTLFKNNMSVDKETEKFLKEEARRSFEDIEKDLPLENYSLRPWQLEMLKKESPDSIIFKGFSIVETIKNKEKYFIEVIAENEGVLLKEFVYEGSNPILKREILGGLSNACINIITNSISHGIEQFRDELEKDEEGQISISIKTNNKDLTLKISDDGRGIDLNKIPFEKLIESEFSTNEEVNQNSGRGVGLGSAYHYIKEILKGDFLLESEVGVGTTITMKIPNVVLCEMELM